MLLRLVVNVVAEGNSSISVGGDDLDSVGGTQYSGQRNGTNSSNTMPKVRKLVNMRYVVKICGISIKK